MPRAPLPPELGRFLEQPRPAVVAVNRADGAPVTAPTWYDLEDGRILLSMIPAGRRIRHLRRDPRVALTVLGDDWYTHLSLLGRVVEFRDDPGLVDKDRLSQRYWGKPFPFRKVGGVTALVEIERWHVFGDPAAAGA